LKLLLLSSLGGGASGRLSMSGVRVHFRLLEETERRDADFEERGMRILIYFTANDFGRSLWDTYMYNYA
jgi:hypothetical protein